MVPKSIRNDLGLLYGVLGSAEKRGWVASNPCKHVELPRAGTHDDGDIRYSALRRSRRSAGRFRTTTVAAQSVCSASRPASTHSSLVEDLVPDLTSP